MNFVSSITKNNTLKNTYKKQTFWSPEIIALFVFVGGYLLIRFIEIKFLPLVPEWLHSETSSFFGWAPILVPIVFGIVYLTPKKKNAFKGEGTNDDILKRRIMFWRKKK